MDLTASIKRIAHLQRLNYDLLDSLRNQVDWLFDFCDRHNIEIPLPDLEKLISLSKTAGDVLNHSPTESQQRFKTTDDSTEQELFDNGKSRISNNNCCNDDFDFYGLWSYVP